VVALRDHIATSPRRDGDILLIRMVEWCIERYYGSEAPGPAQTRIAH
jgi:hypothetical protein